MRRLKHHAGVTLVELMVVIVIGALMLTFAAPAFRDYLVNSRLREAGHVLLGEALFAQSEAIKRNRAVRMVVKGSRLQVVDAGYEGGGEVIRVRELPTDVRADQAVKLTFGSAGRPTPFGTEYTVGLSMKGVSCSGEHRCPSLRVDAGGAVRLCGNKKAKKECA